MRKTRGRISIAIAAIVLRCALALLVVVPFALQANERGTEAAFERDAGGEVVLRALALLGVPYRFGGESPDAGFDCSGLVRHVFRDALGFSLPRRAQEISAHGELVPRGDLLPGDLVFFNTLRSAYSHVGIYVGENRFVHAPTSGGVVRVESIDVDYWSRRFDGARRLAPVAGGSDPVLTRPTLLLADAPAALNAQGALLRAHFMH